jgi:DNA-binding transcriptional MerR regulator
MRLPVKQRMRNEGMLTNKKNWKVGELAKLTGITVRTLHYYDQFGLLSPSEYSDAGHRLYTKADISKLQQIEYSKNYTADWKKCTKYLVPDKM